MCAINKGNLLTYFLLTSEILARPDQLMMTPKVEFSKCSSNILQANKRMGAGRTATLNFVNWTEQMQR